MVMTAALPYCCSAKWLYHCPISSSPPGKARVADYKKQLEDGVVLAKRSGYPQQAFFLFAFSDGQLQREGLKEALEAAQFRLIASGNGAHGTPVHLYARIEDPVGISVPKEPKKRAVKKKSAFF